ncbi:MAG TPA: hypothetical protein VF097_06175 [Actinomycetota bacterium]
MEVTTAMLADAATVENGKLYVHGGAWSVINVRELPVTHPSMALALVFRVEYTEALEDHPIVIELLDEDDQPVGPRIDGIIHVGHPPRMPPGTPSFVPQAIRFNNIRLEREGGYRFRVTVRDDEVASVQFRVLRTRGQ